MHDTTSDDSPAAHVQGVPEWIHTRDGRPLYTMTLPGPRDAETPLVVFEAGAAASRSTWGLVQPEVGRFARAMVYDRSGLGRSPADPGGRTLDRMAQDLVDLIDGIEHGPILLAGHSAGGVIIRLAAARRPDRITGLILVDPTDEAAEFLFKPFFRRAERVGIAVYTMLAGIGVLHLMHRSMLDAVPAQVRADMLREAFTTGTIRTHGAQARTFLDELATWRTAPPDPGDIPVTVISGERAGDGMGTRVRADINAAHARRAASAPRGRHILAHRSGHYVPITEPDVVVEQIRQLLNA